MLGYANPDEFMSISSVDLVIHPDDKAQVRARRLARLKGENAPSEYDLRLISRDGRTVWVDNQVTVIEWDGEPAAFSIYADITHRELAERETELADRVS